MSKNNSDTKVPIPDEENQLDQGQNSHANENNEREQPSPTIECEEASTTVVEDIVSSVLGILPTFITAPLPSSATHIVPTHKSTVSSEKLEQASRSVDEVVVTIENTDTGEVPVAVVPSSLVGSGHIEDIPVIPSETPVNNASNISSNNNNCMALIPYPPTIITSKTSQMIPIALLRKSSNGTSADEGGSSTGPGPGAGFMHLITGCNKVAPAELSNTNTESTGLPTTTVGAVLMLIPKKSDCVCVEGPSNGTADTENNRAIQQEGLQASADPNCKNAGSNHQQDTAAPVPARPAPSYDSYEEVCRICHDNPSKMELISPCLCKGSMSKVHRACLERWLAESAKNSCEICNYEYNTVRKPKYKGCRSIYEWIRHPLSPSDMRNLFFDIACFFILTPLAAISSWLCVVGAQHYTFGEERRRRAKLHGEASALWDVHSGRDPRGGDASNATWTAVGLLSLTGTLLVAYSVWLFVAIKYHIQAWREWQQRNYTVTIVPFEDGCMGRPPPPRPPRNQSNNNNGGSLLGSGGSDLNHSGYSFDANPNLLRYSGHNSVMRGRGRNSIFQRPPSRQQNRRDYNLPPIFSRNHFLRNPPPGYTISETTLLYQALYGSESDTFINDNLLTFFADSSDEITPSSSHLIGEYQYAGILPQQSPPNIITTTGSTPTTTTVTDLVENPGCSCSTNNNKRDNPTLEVIASNKLVDESDSKTREEVENVVVPNNNHVIIPMPPCANEDVEENNVNQGKNEDDQQTRIRN